MRKIFITIGISLLLLTGCEKKIDLKDKVINEAVILDDQVIDGLTIKDFSIAKDSKNNVSTIYFEVVNNSGEVKNVSEITFTMYEGTRENTITEQLDGPIEIEDSRIIRSEVDIDLTKTEKVEYKIQ